VVRVDTAQIPK